MISITVQFKEVSRFEDFMVGGYEYQKTSEHKAFNENAEESFTFAPSTKVAVWRY